MAIHVDELLDMQLVLAHDERIVVPTQLRYASVDPFAVCIAFDIGNERPVVWALARDLLAEGVFRPCGQGDVRIWPTGSGPDAELNLALSSPHGAARFVAPLPMVAQWLERTYRLVPAGTETDGLDVDAELSRLLHGAT
ncbi:SsgA family sporulation/cell division regulator [Streptomyces sp. NPDC046805]|uniref:SsgA family sporulation/cell division regulator n=1 Tax=Streptomyces sp. NPDC046805 TaxID=3155134 RepID=UPI0033D9D0D9